MKPLGPSDPTSVASYRLLGVLGGGGMGRVSLGQSPAGRRLAIKVVRVDLAEEPTFRRRFAHEIAAVQTVNPLFTATIVDADPDADPPWLATTYIDGPNLRDWVTDHGPLAPGAVLLLAAGLAEALASFHRTGLVHRDLKPSNVLLDETGPRIIDFGIAVASGATRLTVSLVGTPSYLAPELIGGGEPSPASDVFSLGATLVFAATGVPLVRDGTIFQQFVQISTGRFDLSLLPRELRPIIVRCLSRRPRDRPTAEELARILVGTGISIPGPDWYGSAPALPAKVGSLGGHRLSRRQALRVGAAVGIAVAGGGLAVATFERAGPAAVPVRPGGHGTGRRARRRGGAAPDRALGHPRVPRPDQCDRRDRPGRPGALAGATAGPAGRPAQTARHPARGRCRLAGGAGHGAAGRGGPDRSGQPRRPGDRDGPLVDPSSDHARRSGRSPGRFASGRAATGRRVGWWATAAAARAGLADVRGADRQRVGRAA